MAEAPELAGIIAPVRLEAGLRHASIEMSRQNLEVCKQYCGSCPSYPQQAGEALFCATGRSNVEIEERGCNCLECPLYDKCAVGSGAYFCKHGAARGTERQDDYLARFVRSATAVPEPESEPPAEAGADSRVQLELEFDADHVVGATSDRTILECATDAGLPITHVCGGRARCSTCRVLIIDGLDNLLPRNAKESRLATAKGLSADVRLACQTRARGSVQLRRLVVDPEDAFAAIDEGRSGSGAVGKDMHVAVLFSDIRAFTAFSERTLPYDLVHILNRYYESVGTIIDARGGFIDKYLGDGIMVIFGLEERSAGNPAAAAVRTARAMRANLETFNRYLRERFDHEFDIGVGICTGTAVIGSVGFHKKREFTAIGDTVNTAARVEALSKKLNRPIVVCENTRAAAGEICDWEGPFSEPVRGKSLRLEVYAASE